MFVCSDCSFGLTANFWPCPFCHDAPREPTEVEDQVVKSSQVVSDTVAVGVNDCEKVGSGGLDKRFISDGIVCLAAKASRTAGLGGWNSMCRHFVHHCLPSSLCHFRIVRCEISASEIEVKRWLPVRLVHRVK